MLAKIDAIYVAVLFHLDTWTARIYFLSHLEASSTIMLFTQLPKAPKWKETP